MSHICAMKSNYYLIIGVYMCRKSPHFFYSSRERPGKSKNYCPAKMNESLPCCIFVMLYDSCGTKLLHLRHLRLPWNYGSMQKDISSYLLYKLQLSRKSNCWSLRCSWSSADIQLYSWINTWLQWIGQRQLQDETEDKHLALGIWCALY